MIPAPFSWMADGVILAVRGLWMLAAHITGNISALGPAWVVAYWLLLVGLWNLGTWGAHAVRGVRRGNDAFEFDPGRRGGSWLGRPAAFVIRAQVAGEAWAATMATVIGYGGALVLLVIGVVWQWLLVGFGVWAMTRAAEARRRTRLRARR
jgi:hypothetical protein